MLCGYVAPEVSPEVSLLASENSMANWAIDSAIQGDVAGQRAYLFRGGLNRLDRRRLRLRIIPCRVCANCSIVSET